MNYSDNTEFEAINEDVIGSSFGSKSDFDYRVPPKTVMQKIQKLTVAPPKKESKGMFNEFYQYKINYDGRECLRRFSDFDKLHQYLINLYRFAFFPHLPEKNALSKVKGLASQDFLEHRRRSLEMFLKKILTHSKCAGNGADQKMDDKVKDFFDGSLLEFKVDVAETGLKAIAGDLGHISKQKFGKAKSFFKGLFGKKTEEDETIMKPTDGDLEMTNLKKLIEDMNEKLRNIITHVEKVIEKMKQKAEASQAQAETFGEIKDEDFALSAELLSQLKKIQEDVSEKELTFCEELKEEILFYLKDLKLDIEEALSRISKSIEKTEQLDALIRKASSKGDSDKEESLKSDRESHSDEQKILCGEIKNFRAQVSESIQDLFEAYFEKSKTRNDLEVEKWGQINLAELKN